MKKYIQSGLLLILIGSLVAFTGCETKPTKVKKTEKKEVQHKNHGSRKSSY